MAVITLVCGLLGLFVIPLIGSVIAVILGPMARKEIARTAEEGSSLATAGIITGWVGIALYGLAIVAVILMIVFSFGLFAVAASSAPSY